ncbi:hypothetical protein PoB_002701700 [Plakobranchus ocellatus]|uniref:Uncharacterized protein n=1 Tax=Plakobranchus ocellatus TaxID=259542 RepID=A0AAV4A0U8_9GAST|nr:hypothetical protein PoB_002701700 [Plakobranchus ocellatus]
MKYVAIFFVALVVVAIADDSDDRDDTCYLDGEKMPDGSKADCRNLYNSYTHRVQGDVACCVDPKMRPDLNYYGEVDGFKYYGCTCWDPADYD